MDKQHKQQLIRVERSQKILNNKEAIWILMNSGGNGLIGRGK